MNLPRRTIDASDQLFSLKIALALGRLGPRVQITTPTRSCSTPRAHLNDRLDLPTTDPRDRGTGEDPQQVSLPVLQGDDALRGFQVPQDSPGRAGDARSHAPRSSLTSCEKGRSYHPKLDLPRSNCVSRGEMRACNVGGKSARDNDAVGYIFDVLQLFSACNCCVALSHRQAGTTTGARTKNGERESVRSRSRCSGSRCSRTG